MAMRKEELAEKSGGSSFEVPGQALNPRPKEACLAGYVAGVSRQVELSTGIVRKFRYNNLLALSWVQDSDGSYFRPDTNGFWVRKKGRQRFRLKNLAVDKEGVLRYLRQLGANQVAFVENLDGTVFGRDQEGRLVYTEFPDGEMRLIQYDASGQIVSYATGTDTAWTTSDGLAWRNSACGHQAVYGLMSISAEDRVQFICLSGRPEQMSLNTKLDLVLGPNDPLFKKALLEILKSRFFDHVDKNEKALEAALLYKMARNREIGGAERLSAMMLFDFARRLRLKQVSPGDFCRAADLPSQGRAYKEMATRVVNLSNYSSRLEVRKASGKSTEESGPDPKTQAG